MLRRGIAREDNVATMDPSMRSAASGEGTTRYLIPAGCGVIRAELLAQSTLVGASAKVHMIALLVRRLTLYTCVTYVRVRRRGDLHRPTNPSLNVVGERDARRRLFITQLSSTRT